MKTILSILLFSSLLLYCSAQDPLILSGLISGTVLYNPSNELPYWFGLRYLPQINRKWESSKSKAFDFEASANLFCNLGLVLLKEYDFDGKIKPYRTWIRYSGKQFEVRLGLQKINFGSAMMFRPLMWFDQVDPRDPLQLTDGVWALLGRYYFLNNVNFWLWGLWGNKEAKMWETAKTVSNYPEFGGRIQTPFVSGECAISYHFRIADTHDLVNSPLKFGEVSENRLGLDGKWDIGVGVWFEVVWINKHRNVGITTNQHLLTLGADYTIGIGNGLNLLIEQFLYSNAIKAFHFPENYYFSAISLNYPIGIFDQIQTIFFFDWRHSMFYSFINWKKQFNKLNVNLIGYWNPNNYNLPGQYDDRELYGGKGVQIIVSYKY